MQIKVYTTSTCPYCQSLKAFLQEKGVSFEEAVVDQDAAKLEEMRAASEGFSGVPFIVVTLDDGSLVKIRGFDREKLEEVLKGAVGEEAAPKEPMVGEETPPKEPVVEETPEGEKGLQEQPAVSGEEASPPAPQEEKTQPSIGQPVGSKEPQREEKVEPKGGYPTETRVSSVSEPQPKTEAVQPGTFVAEKASQPGASQQLDEEVLKG